MYAHYYTIEEFPDNVFLFSHPIKEAEDFDRDLRTAQKMEDPSGPHFAGLVLAQMRGMGWEFNKMSCKGIRIKK